MTNGECNCNLKCIKSWEGYATEGCIYGAYMYDTPTCGDIVAEFGDNNGNIVTITKEEFKEHFTVTE